MNVNQIAISGAVLLGLIFVGGQYFSRPVAKGTLDVPNGPIVAVKLPNLTTAQEIGKTAFDAKCAVCHGGNAAGKNGAGPPLVHKFYRPGHHDDGAFVRAAQQGVRAHHWPFGDMPKVAGVTVADIKMIVGYIRALQRENGIY